MITFPVVCKEHSTTTALLGVREDIKRAMKRREVTSMVLADFLRLLVRVRFVSRRR